MNLLVSQPDREAAAGIFGRRTRIVLPKSAGHVLGNAGVKGAIPTAENVNEPITFGSFGLR